jgi:hypothetical protein
MLTSVSLHLQMPQAHLLAAHAVYPVALFCQQDAWPPSQAQMLLDPVTTISHQSVQMVMQLSWT